MRNPSRIAAGLASAKPGQCEGSGPGSPLLDCRALIPMPALELDATEARILGVLIEKEATTPDQYPLTLNALTVGCNQRSNRDPVLELSDSDVTSGIERLRRKSLVGAAHAA